jgi:hypothetical protein
MRSKYIKASVLLFTVLLPAIMMPSTVGDSNVTPQSFQGNFGVLNLNLYVSIPPSLYNYYGNESCKVNKDADYVRLVTPKVVEPIAARIKNLTSALPNGDEQFANAVLGLVHQIPYNVTGPKFPVETLVDNSADCTALSLLAASIMKAGGLDVVLIHYTGISPGHINVGVYLPYRPAFHTVFMAPTSFEYANKTYWTAEATAEADWKVGDQSGSLAVAQPVIIPLDNVEDSSIGRVSASLSLPLLPSSIDLSLSQQQSSDRENGRSLIISGSILPAQSNNSIIVYVNHNGASSNCFVTLTDNYGSYMLIWNFTSDGTYYITTSWNGDSNYAGADSETLAVFIGPESLVQFQTTVYNYIYARAGMGSYALRPFLGVNNFLCIPLGTNVSFSYDFAVLPTGHEGSNVQTENVTIPARKQTIFMPRRQTRTIVIPESTLIVPTNVPLGLQPLRLPDDFNKTINNKFCLFLHSSSADNYSLSLKGLNSYDMTEMQDPESNTTFANASGLIEENIWYNVMAVIATNGITIDIKEKNGTLVQNETTPYDTTGTKEMVILITDNVDSAIAFRNLEIQMLNETAKQSLEKSNPPSSGGELAPYIVMSFLLALIFATVMVLIAKINHSQKNGSSSNELGTARNLKPKLPPFAYEK